LGVRSLDGQELSYQALWTVAEQQALLGELFKGAGRREQMLACLLGRLVQGVADPELLCVDLERLSIGVGVREVRHTVGAHALGEADPTGHH
jgi:hypothetical protein